MVKPLQLQYKTYHRRYTLPTEVRDVHGHTHTKNTPYIISKPQMENNNIKRSCQFTHVHSGHNEWEINEKDEVPVNIMNSIKATLSALSHFKKR